MINLHPIFVVNCHVCGRRSAMGFRLLLYSILLLHQLMVMGVSSSTCQSFLKAPDCAVGTSSGEQMECSWCIRESDSSQRDMEGNIKEVGKCVSVGERSVYEASNYTCTIFNEEVLAEAGTCRHGKGCTQGYTCSSSVIAPTTVKSTQVFIVGKQCVNRQMKCNNIASTIFKKYCKWGEKRDTMYWCPLSDELKESGNGNGFCVCASSEQNALSMLRSSTKEYQVSGNVNLCRVKEARVDKEAAYEELEATASSLKSRMAMQQGRKCLKNTKFQYTSATLEILYKNSMPSTQSVSHSNSACWLRKQWSLAKNYRSKSIGSSCSYMDSHECCLRNLGKGKSGCAWCMPTKFLDVEGPLEFPKTKEIIQLRQWKNATRLLYDWAKIDPQSTHKALNFINNKYVQQLQKERDVGVKLDTIKKRILDSLKMTSESPMSQTATMSLVFWFDFFDRQYFAKGLGAPPVAGISAACPNCKCVENVNVEHVEKNGYCCFYHQTKNVITAISSQNMITRKQPSSKAHYEWKIGAWGKCSKACGYGQAFRNVECIKVQDAEGADNETVSNKLCLLYGKVSLDNSGMPVDSKDCILSNCTRWKVEQLCNFSTCSPHAEISCQGQDPAGDWKVVNNSECEGRSASQTRVLPYIKDNEFLNHFVYIDAPSARPNVDLTNIESCCKDRYGYKWLASNWTGACNDGCYPADKPPTRIRPVTCVKYNLMKPEDPKNYIAEADQTLCSHAEKPATIDTCKTFTECLRWRATQYCEEGRSKMHAICEKELSLGKWKKVDDAQCLQKCPYAESENQVLEEKSLLELKALRIERMTPNSFECHEKSENIENQEDQIFLDVKRCKPTFSCRNTACEGSCKYKFEASEWSKCDNSTCGPPGETKKRVREVNCMAQCEMGSNKRKGKSVESMLES